MNRRNFLLGLLTTAAAAMTKAGDADAQAAYCYDNQGFEIPCGGGYGYVPRGVVRRSRQRRRRRVRRVVRRSHRRARVRNRIRRRR